MAQTSSASGSLRPDRPGHGSVRVAGVTLAADCAGALYWPEEGLLVVADLHLEKGSSFARRGTLLPPYDTTETLGAARAADRALRAARGHHAGRQLSRPRRPCAPLGRRPCLAHGAAARARLDLDHRQSRSRSGRRHRRLVRRDAHLRQAPVPPRALARCARRRDRRAPASGGAHRAARPRGEPALLCDRRRSRW